ncbi:JAB domain-containing protein [Azonexus hydrophilus]|uniref:JAB domain-containing protein n=1 Tax=Azonexus hydrophilus TaxID=418702 RepID=UPI000411966A
MMAVQNTTPASAPPAAKRRGRPPKIRAQEVAPPSCIERLEPGARRAVERAIRALEESAVYRTEPMNNPGAAGLYLKLRLAALEHEEFHVLWLDAQHRLIVAEAMFSGTLTQASVYPREIVKAALRHNAAACILAHNHPSGIPEPSRADELLTGSITRALALVDVRVLDHFIVAGTAEPLSFASRGLL